MRSTGQLTALAAGVTGDQRGFSLMEAVVATAIAVIAVLGLAHSFGMGSALIARYEIGRVALGAAGRRMDSIAARPAAGVSAPSADSVTFIYKGQALGYEKWTIQWVDDPYDGTGGLDISGSPQDLKRATVTIQWANQGGGMNRVQLERMLPGS